MGERAGEVRGDMTLRASPEFALGDRTQRGWADELARCGRAALPTYAFDSVVAETKAPMMVVPAGLIITPDVLTFRRGGKIAWHEVKAKTGPSWRRLLPGPRWEHGFDFSLLAEYLEVERLTRVPVFVVVGEIASPDNRGDLVPPGCWLYVALDELAREGERRPDWPGGRDEPSRRGRHGMGGWLWDRRIMRRWGATP